MAGFRNYYSSMPWLGVPFDADTRERLLSWMKVTGVPRLMVLDGKTGKILESNAVGRTLDLARFSTLGRHEVKSGAKQVERATRETSKFR